MGLFDAVGGALSFISSERTNSSNRGTANRQMDFQRYMSNTAHQREVEDLRKARLNPILSVNNGASTPAGAMAHIEDSGAKAISTVQQSRRLKEEIENMKQQNEVLKTQSLLNDTNNALAHTAMQKNDAETMLSKALSVKALEDAKLSTTNARSAAANARLLEAQLPGALIKEGINSSTFGKVMSHLDRIIDTVGGATSAANPLKDLFRKTPTKTK